MSSRYGLQIRSATVSDATGLAELMGSAGFSVTEAVLAERLAAIRKGAGTTLLAFEWGPPSGVIGVTWFPTLDADQATARITMLLVNPSDRRRGIGRLLLKAAAQAARSAGCGSLDLHAGAGDEVTLRAFGRASGFEDAGPCLVRALRKRAPGRDP
ncbi:MAG: putative Acetyltransferase [Enterovirga sp.]|jgi:aminoglycoside 6'-N-acetyltransferase I|nr:putative Acetyltransferase [Enterovirga sp.]